MARSLNGLELQGFVKERQAHQVRGLIQHFKSQPKLAIIQTVDDAVTNLYTKIKQNYGRDILIEVELYKVKQPKVAELIQRLNNDNSVKGIILQLPLANSGQTDELINLIAPQKDVDGLGQKAVWDSATAMAINWLLAGYNVELTGKKIAIVGQGRLVGKPLLKMWQKSGYDVIGLDESCDNLIGVLQDMDVVVSATGVPGLITSNMLKPKAVVVDAGTTDQNGQIMGDVDVSVRERADISITPIKGGVGPLTVAALMDNVIRASYPVNK